jgi:low affinity Fe/Cu permease
MAKPKKKNLNTLERIALRATRWVGSTHSLILHTILFFISFLLCFMGIDISKVLLVVTTIVSLEAIYLSIFIQMSVNYQARKLHAVSRDIEEIQEDVEEIQEDVDEIQEETEEEEKLDDPILNRMEQTLSKLMEEVTELKKQNDKNKK